MNKNRKRSSTNRSIQQENKKVDNIEEVPDKKSTKIDTGNESPQHSYELRVSGHSTPIRKRDYMLDIEDSPELDYRCSPISLPCTQDGGNEIAWDWQISVGKNCNENIKGQNSIETPKRTKLLQKKRNSNSPLLQQPLKRKQVKMENIENIGKLAAELKALTEKMKSMQQNSENDSIMKEENVKHEHGTQLLIELDNENNDDLMLEVGINNDKPKIDGIKIEHNIKKESNYEDLFDDSIEDSMVKCSQEIEEKLNLYRTKGNDVMEFSTVTEEKESSSTSEREIKCFTTSNNSTASSGNSNISKSSLSINTSSRLRTYSNTSSKTNSTSNASISSSMGAKTRKSLFDNSVINIPDGKHTLQEKDTSVFPNDSFDDCLATCVEDDKLLSKLSEYDFNITDIDNDSSHSKKISKQAASNTVNNKRTSNSFVPKTVDITHNVKSHSHNNSRLITNDLVDDISASDHKEMIQQSFVGNNALTNRKFFKTKSLSDQYFYQTKNSNANSKTSKTTSSSEKRFKSNSVNSPVSTTFPIVKGQNPHESNKLSSINGAENAHTLNRLEAKEGGNCTIKYKSTSNLCSIKEVKESQSNQCTPQEIERKRLEAKMRLEAKRKLQQNTRVANAPSEVPVKKSVKR